MAALPAAKTATTSKFRDNLNRIGLPRRIRAARLFVVSATFNRLRWLTGFFLLAIGVAYWLYGLHRSLDGTGPHVVIVFLVGLSLIVLGFLPFVVDVARWLARPLLRFIDSVYLPGGHEKRPLLNLDLPLYYERHFREEEAVAAYEAVVHQDPKAMAAYAGLIRIHRDVFGDEFEAERWLARARHYWDEETVLQAAAKTPEQLYSERVVSIFGVPMTGGPQ